ncbi:unnamed protein product [Pieris macdunnoughi]|uniref:Gustatory receptor n=1 Tax=Pieris macdunnoughi TaxID=345717 RepID=A0A821QWD1_9NEOP|nr:unnamed protein product [Pieris macdunnoughi]
MVSTIEEWGYCGLIKYIGRFSRMFGSFPFIMSSEPKVATWQKYYGIFIILPWINTDFFYSLYIETKDITESSGNAWPVIYLIYTAFSVLYINMAVWTAPTRIYSWISCLKNIEKILIRTKETDKQELFKCKVLTVYLITTLFAIFANSVKLCMDLDKCTNSQNFSHGEGAEKIRKLTSSYKIISDVIKTVMESGEMGFFLYIMGNLVRLMTRANDYVYLNYAVHGENFDGSYMLTSILEIFWCTQIVAKSFLFCEGPHQIQRQLQETQDLIARLKKKYHEDNISNYLHLFLRLTRLNRPTFTPLSVCTLNRGLVAKIRGTLAT